ncbi:hypothetical protein CPB83DRAFT_837812 [Crepidotus variabilis]|uniref:F-box domain-containing protein n=1 Tax=Crepidotus variabilis TaxID=179855 RepID=A0A9P6EAP2_9AGAR|nr:hypothetical protein CPB83DRAFT_837812 [Crepidotus variabilis]
MSYPRSRTSAKYPIDPQPPHGPFTPIHNIPPAALMPVSLAFTPHYQDLHLQLPAQRAQVHTLRTRRHTPQLPPEIIAEIVTFITDKPTLAACARVALTFYQPAQKIFFSEVTLYFWPYQKAVKQTPRRFYSLLKRSPHLIKLIRSLSVHTGSTCTSTDEVYYLHKVAPYLIKLESLSFPRLPSNNVSQPTELPFFPPLTDEQTTNLRKLDISALTDHQFPSLTFFTRLYNLRDLTLDPSFSNESSIAWSLRHNPHSYTQISLKSLSIVGKSTLDQAVTLFGSTAFPFNIDGRLRMLSVDQSDVQWVDLDPYRDLKPLASLFSTCRDLEHFSFTRCPRSTYAISTREVITPFSKLSRPPNLSNAFSLKTITLQGKAEAIANEFPGHGVQRSNLERWVVASPISWMEILLASIQPGSRVRVREVNLRIDTSHYMFEQLLGVMDAQWDGLCGVLTPQRFPSLRRVRLHVRSNLEKDPQIIASILSKHSALRRLMKHGILRLDLS